MSDVLTLQIVLTFVVLVLLAIVDYQLGRIIEILIKDTKENPDA